jgi:hypothetical protein
MKKFMNYAKISILSIFIFLIGIIFSQRKFLYNGVTFEEQTLHYLADDTIKFLKNIDKYSPDKPTAIFLTGSLPVPLVIKFYDTINFITPISNFDCSNLLEIFNLIIVGKPYTPLVMNYENVVENSLVYVPDINLPNCFDTNYIKTNNIYYISERINTLINSLFKSKQIKEKRLLLIGHSQGAVEAARIGRINPLITDIALTSVNLIGRYQFFLMNNRLDYQYGKINFIEYKKRKEELLNNFNEAILNPEKSTCYGDNNLNIISFSESAIDDIIKTKANIFYGCGSRDFRYIFSDLLSLECIKVGKTNCFVKIYENLEHNFFEVDKNEQVDYQKGNWDKVIDDIIEWFRQNKYIE